MNENKLIAEFMKYEIKYNKCYSPKYNDGTIAPMQFHSSWDWLMPVVEKIYSIDADIDFFKSINLEATYKEVVEFIKEYNKYICGSCGENCNEYTYNEETDVDECNQCKII